MGEVRELDNSLKTLVVERIRGGIVSGLHKPGTRLIEQALADDLGISRGPVREAILQLQQEGLVRISPRRGAVVTSLTPNEAADIYILRGHLESLAVRLARENWTPRDTAALRTSIAGMKELGPDDWMGAIAADRQFHAQILAASRHQSLIQMYSSLDTKVAACFVAVRWLLSSHANEMAQRHEKLEDVLAQGDFMRAEYLAFEHWAETAARFRAIAASVSHEAPENIDE